MYSTNDFNTHKSDAFAIALNRMFKYETKIVRGFYTGDKGQELTEDIRAVTLNESGQIVDAAGLRNNTEALNECEFVNEINEVQLVDISISELEGHFSRGGVDADDVYQARLFIQKNISKFQ